MTAKRSKRTDKKAEFVPPHVGAEIKKWRLARDLTQAQLGEAMGCSKGHVSGIENGAGNLSLPAFLAACKKLDVPASRLLGEKLSRSHREVDDLVTALLEALGTSDLRWLASLSKADAREAISRGKERIAYLETERHKRGSKTG